MNSPWAKLMTRITPKIRDRPAASSAYTPPSSRPSRTYCRRWVTAAAACSSAGPPQLADGLVDRRDGDRLAVLPLDDGHARLGVGTLLVELPAAARHLGGGAARDVERRHGVADLR